MNRKNAAVLPAALLMLALLFAGKHVQAQSVIISEFSADNEYLQDEDGHDPDWIELLNLSNATVDLNGWYLTDDRDNLTQWPFPSLPLTAGARLVVFASGKDRRNPPGNLHTNFQLDRGGEYLALVQSDGTPAGTTVAYEISPRYPDLPFDVSFGIASSNAAMLVAEGATADIHIPSDNSLGLTWTQDSFTPSAPAWFSGPTGVGFAVSGSIQTAGALYVDVDATALANGPITSLPNNGALGTGFTNQGDPQIAAVDGVQAMVFDGNDALRLDAVAPADINGVESWSIEAWAYNTALEPGETLVNAWHRLGDGSGSFFQGSSTAWGAFGAWANDLGYGAANFPTVNQWHHLALTNEGGLGGAIKVYVDGQPSNQRTMAVALRSGAGATAIYLGGSTQNPGLVGTAVDHMLTGAIARVRVHGGELTAAQALNNYNAEKAAFGIGGGGGPVLNTDIEARMHGINSGAYLRLPFNITGDPAVLYNTLRLRIKYDDGFIAYLNGVKVAERNQPASPQYNSTATAEVLEPALADIQAETIGISQHLGALRSGANVLAIHGLNYAVADDDFLILPELSAAFVDPSAAWYLSRPTPGEPNGYHVPGITGVEHDPQQPTSAQTCVITADVADPTGIAGVTLSYQLVTPGGYVPAFLPLDHATLQGLPNTANPANPAFENPANWVNVAMADDGTGADAQAGDGTYTALLPVRPHRTLVRYRILATNGAAATIRSPYPLDPSLNHAYFVYDGVPAYTADTLSVNGAPHTYSATVMNALPAYHLITREPDILECHAYNVAEQLENGPAQNQIDARRKYNWFGTLVYDGVVYDNISYRLRGANGRYHLSGKRSMKIRFHPGRSFQARDNSGKAYPQEWRRLMIGKMFGNRLDGNFGLSESINYKLFNLWGVPAPATHWFQFRVIDAAQEVPADANGQYNGDFWGMYLAFEHYDQNFLQAHNLPDGNLYKLTKNVFDGLEQLRYHAPDAVYDGSDYENFRWNMVQPQTEAWLRDRCDYEIWFRFHGIADAIKHWDYFHSPTGGEVLKNMTWYFHPSANPLGQCWTLPFDTDASWGPTWNVGLDQPKFAIYNAANHTALQMEYRNQLRELRDLLFRPDVIDPTIDDYASVIAAFSPADRDRWRNHPTTPMDFGPLQNKADGMKQFAWTGGSWPGGSVPAGGQAGYVDGLANAGGDAANIPNTPTVTYTGPAGYLANRLTFSSSAFADPQGAGTFAAMKWRIGEVLNPSTPNYQPGQPWRFEIEQLWDSGELTVFNASVRIPSTAVIPGHTYRVRARHKDNTGRWGHWSAPAELIAGEPDSALELAAHLRISELMYNPPAGGDFEFIELFNASTTTTIEFNGEVFTDAIDYMIPSGVQIPPGGHLLVSKDTSANFTTFRAHYGLGAGVSIVGPYGGGLNNGGERLELSRTADGLKLVAFEYSDGRGWPLAPDGGGHSLVPLSESDQPWDSLYYGGHWRASTYVGGSPGAADPLPPASVLLNELMAHTDYSNPAYPAYDSNDWIELYNPTAAAVPLDGWWLSDDVANPRKWAIPPTANIAGGGYLDFDEVTDFHQPIASGFGLNKDGEELLLSHFPGGGQDRIVDAVRFKGQESLISLGRLPDGDQTPFGPFWYPLTPSRNAANSGNRLGAIISEIMYHPALPSGETGDTTGSEFLELYNPSPLAVALWNAAGAWRIDGGVSYVFPPATSIPGGGGLLIAPFDPADAVALTAFKTAHGVTGDIPCQVLGPYSGILSNSGERIALERPQAPDAPGGNVSWVIADEAIYFDRAPFPAGADGLGPSLHRLTASQAGNDPANWRALPASPGVNLEVASTARNYWMLY